MLGGSQLNGMKPLKMKIDCRSIPTYYRIIWRYENVFWLILPLGFVIEEIQIV